MHGRTEKAQVFHISWYMKPQTHHLVLTFCSKLQFYTQLFYTVATLQLVCTTNIHNFHTVNLKVWPCALPLHVIGTILRRWFPLDSILRDNGLLPAL